MSGNTSATGGFLLPLNMPVPELDTVLADILQTWVVGLTALPGTLVRPRWQNAPIPAPPIDTDWCAIGVTRQYPDEYGYRQHDPNGDGVDWVTFWWTLETMATFYGPRAMGYAERLKFGSSISQNRAYLRANSMGVQEINNVTFAPEFISAQFRPRADLPMVLRRSVSMSYPVLNMLGGQVTITASNHVTETINITNEEPTP